MFVTPRFIARSQRRIKLSGWRFGIACSAVASCVVLIINIILAVVVAALSQSLNDGIGTIYVGNCSVVNSWSSGLHIVINALSSTLLAASNYTMQCLSAPTRAEVDAKHMKGHYLDIGAHSPRNLTLGVSRRRAFGWLILALSSTPIHLLYNSVVFKTVTANSYGKCVYSLVKQGNLG